MRTLTSKTHPAGLKDTGSVRQFLNSEAKEHGFDAIAIAAPDAIPLAASRLARCLDDGHHGTMEWMRETAERRGSPVALWPEVRSVILFAMNYGPADDPLALLERRDRATISVYARNRDYHDIIKGRLKQIAGRFTSRCGADVKVFVDTAPVMEKPLAEAAGLGWQGKHTNLVSRAHGSWLFLGSIFTDLQLPPDEAEKDHCGSCRACLDICPTKAFPEPYQLDARRCISYLTIEHKGPIAHEFRTAMGNRIYGCDDCLAVCPWNKFAGIAREAKLVARDDLSAPRLESFLAFDDAAFRRFFSGSPVKRIGRNRFLRNALIAAGNSGDRKLIAPCRMLMTDPSSLVRGAAVWALHRLQDRPQFGQLAEQFRPCEQDPDVLAEWNHACAPKGGAGDKEAS